MKKAASRLINAVVLVAILLASAWWFHFRQPEPRDTRIERREPIHTDHTILSAGDHHGSTYFQHRKFLDLVKNGGRPEVSLEDGLKAVVMGAAAEESARTGKSIDL